MARSFHFYENMLQSVDCFDESIRYQVLRAIIEYGLYQQEPDDPTIRALIQAFKPSMDKHRTPGGQRIGAGAPKGNNNASKKEIKTESPEPEVVEPEIVAPQNKFADMTDDPSIRAELENPDSAISVFLKTGSRYDELSKTECEFADRADVRAKCEWHKEIQAAAREIKNPMPPTEEEVLAYAREQNSIAGMGGFACSDEEALNFFDYYSGLGWHVPNSANTPLRVWKPFLRKWARSPLRSLQQFKPRMSLKDIKESENHIKLQKMLDGEL